MLRKLLLALLLLAALDAAAMVLFPRLVPVEKIAAAAREQVKAATGRDLDFSGVEFVFWPNIGVELKQVTLSNPVWAKEKNMMSIGRIDVALAVMPLLERHIVIKKFVLDAPAVTLEIGADGRRNWDFFGEKASFPPGRSGSSARGGGLPQGFDLQFGNMKISGGRLHFADRKKGSVLAFEDIDADISLPDLKSALSAKGDFTYRKKRAHLALMLEKPMDFLQDKPSNGSFGVKTDDIAAAAEGVLSLQGALLKGKMKADISSLSALAAWAGNGKEEKLPFEKASFSSAAHLTPKEVILKGAALTLDEVEAKGDLTMSFTGKPGIFARLSLNKLTLDRFTGGAPENASAGGAAGNRGDWDPAPLDFSGLKAVNADLELKTEGFSLRGAEVGPSLLTVKLQDGNLRFASSEASLFGGAFSSDMTINAASAVPSLAFTFDMAGVQAKPVLTTFAQFKKLSGTADARVSVTSSGNSQRSLIGNLGGGGSVVFRNGALEGIDLVNIAQLVQKRLADMNIGQGKTDFVELGGTFTVNSGVASNADLKMKGPLLQATGQGIVDLPKKFVQYRVVPVLTASSAVEGAAGLAVPVDIRGPFSHIKIKPDYAAAVQNVIDNPQAAKDTARVIRDQGRVIRKNIKDIRKELKKDPAAAIQSILGGGLLAPPPEEPAAEPAPAAAPDAAPPEQQPQTQTAP